MKDLEYIISTVLNALPDSAKWPLFILLLTIGFNCEKWNYDPVEFIELEIVKCERVGAVQATITADASNIQNTTITQQGFCYAGKARPTIEDDTTRVEPLKKDGTFQAIIAGLDIGTVYYVAPFVVTADGDILYGEAKLLTTPNVLIATDRLVRTNYSAREATGVGIISGLQNAVDDNELIVAIQHGHCWSTEVMVPRIGLSCCDSTQLGEKRDNGIFRSELSGLQIDIPYYICSYATIGDTTIYSNVVSFVLESSWREREGPPTVGRGFALGFAIDNRGYVGTGFTIAAAPIYCRDFWQYEPSTNSWEEMDSVPGPPRAFAVGFSINGKGYAGLGYGENGRFLDDFYEFDPSTGCWSPTDAFRGEARQGAFSFVIDVEGKAKAYVGGGEKALDSGQSVFAEDFWEFDPSKESGQKWNQLNDFKGTPRLYATAFSINDKGYVGAGMISIGEKVLSGFPISSSPKGIDDFWEYDPHEDDWIRRPEVPGGKRSISIGFALRGKGYIGAGIYETIHAQKDFWEYDPEMNSWFNVDDLEVPIGRALSIGLAIGDKGYIGFGKEDADPTHWLNNFLEFCP